jgi:uncharacterized repeat protein (TIGR01451 family)
MRKHLRLIVGIVMVLGLALGSHGDVFAASAPQPSGSSPTATQGGTAILNVATATYADAAGETYSTISNTVQTTVALIGALVVDPKVPAADLAAAATDRAPAGPTTRTFTITNTSNIPDAYTITTEANAAAALVSIVYRSGSASIPVTVGSTVSPTVAPGDSISVAVKVDTTGLSIDTAVPVTITARTTATGTTNGLQSDSAEQWIVVAKGADLVGPGGPNTRIAKTVDHTTVVQSQPGGTVTYDIVAMNSGGSAAANVVVTDAIPTGLTADPATVVAKIDGAVVPSTADLAKGTLTVRVASLPSGSTLDVSFACAVPNGQTIGLTYVNVAAISADGIPNLPTTPTSVLTGSANIVFDGYAGGVQPVGGAIVTLLDANGQPVVLSTGHAPSLTGTQTGSFANAQNPYVTGPDGTYGFDLDASKITGPTQYMLTISSPNYLNRRIALDLTPGSGGTPLYDVAVTALDNQPLAMAGGFSLTSTNVNIDNIFGFFGNLPLFRARTLVVTKNVDRQVAQPGDRLDYSIDIQNTSASTIGSTQIVDTLPAGLAYAPGTAKLDGVALEPTINGRTLTWTVPALAPSSDTLLTYVCVVYPSVASGTNLTNSVGVTGLIPGTTATTTANANVSVQIVGGAFSQRQVITGRVFVDAMKTGRFRSGDTGIAGVRVFLEDGSSVVTDAQGRFSFPGARPGMHVLRVDPTTLPLGVHPYDGYPVTSSRSAQQLVHGLMDDGLIEDVEFAMAPQ